MDNANLIQTILIYILPVLFAITAHEAAHAYAARALGDNTAASMGRVTLNPLPHIDMVGTIIMPLVLYFATSGAFVFGYAKPVPVIERNLRNPRRDMVLVALAGPASNFIQAVGWAIVMALLFQADIQETFFLAMAKAGILVNLVMWAFNLFPIPPLDGGRVLVGLLPYQAAQWVARIEPFGFFVVMGLVVTGVVNTLWMGPLLTTGLEFISWIVLPLQN